MLTAYYRHQLTLVSESKVNNKNGFPWCIWIKPFTIHLNLAIYPGAMVSTQTSSAEPSPFTIWPYVDSPNLYGLMSYFFFFLDFSPCSSLSNDHCHLLFPPTDRPVQSSQQHRLGTTFKICPNVTWHYSWRIIIYGSEEVNKAFNFVFQAYWPHSREPNEMFHRPMLVSWMKHLLVCELVDQCPWMVLTCAVDALV